MGILEGGQHPSNVEEEKRGREDDQQEALHKLGEEELLGGREQSPAEKGRGDDPSEPRSECAEGDFERGRLGSRKALSSTGRHGDRLKLAFGNDTTFPQVKSRGKRKWTLKVRFPP